MKKVLITGVTGQTGSVLVEKFLEKGDQVHGMIRRNSNFNTRRIDHIYNHPNLKLFYGDLSDYSSICSAVSDLKPDYFINCGAQSYVKASFDIPEYTFDIDGTGVIRCLEAVRKFSKDTRFLQCSTSELYGSTPPPQSESTPFHPRSPYGAAKIGAYWAVVNYREAYNMFAVNSISFNHETVADFMPVIIKIDDEIQIKTIEEVVINDCGISFNKNNQFYQEGEVKKDIFIWDKSGWTKIKFASGYPHSNILNNKKPRFINARKACYATTHNHEIIMQDLSEKTAENLEIGDFVNLINLPEPIIKNNNILDEEARLIGFIVGDGTGRSRKNSFKITGKDMSLLEYYKDIWISLGGTATYEASKSGFNQEIIHNYHLLNNIEIFKKYEIYNNDGFKIVPKNILNSNKEIQLSFLNGYNDADGLKNNPTKYLFKNFKTNSAVLASGLVYLISNTTNQDYNITIEENNLWGSNRFYYSINLLSNNSGFNERNSVSSIEKYNLINNIISSNEKISGLEISRKTGININFIYKIRRGHIPQDHHLKKNPNEIKKIIEMPDFNGWFFDLETESSTFHCGIGAGHVHNSPRRSEHFVTRKITRAATRIKLGLQDKLTLGNLEAKRDWCDARDIASGQIMMLEADTPDDYVLCSGKSRSVKEFADIVFTKLGLNYQDYVEVSDKHFRPSEVDHLCGDYTKIKNALGWEPQISFDQMVEEMIDHDLKLAQQEQILAQNGFKYTL